MIIIKLAEYKDNKTKIIIKTKTKMLSLSKEELSKLIKII